MSPKCSDSLKPLYENWVLDHWASLLPRCFKTHLKHMLALLHRVKHYKKFSWKNTLSNSHQRMAWSWDLPMTRGEGTAVIGSNVPHKDGTKVNKRTEELLLPFICQVTGLTLVVCSALNSNSADWAKCQGEYKKNWCVMVCHISPSCLFSPQRHKKIKLINTVSSGTDEKQTAN